MTNDIPKIVYQDGEVVVLEKPAGMVVNRSVTVGEEETVQDFVEQNLQIRNPKHEIRNKFKIQNSKVQNSSDFFQRAGIVHRLDRETSGLLIVAKTPEAFVNLQAQFKNRQVKKEYIALVHGKIAGQSGTIEERIGRVGKFGKFGVAEEGREARTEYKVEDYFKFGPLVYSSFSVITKSRLNYLKHHAVDYTFLRLFPQTGRTHQIRVHLKSIGHPVVSDALYAPRKLLQFDLLWCPRLFLHAAKISFAHPASGKTVTLSSDLPKDLKDAILNLCLLPLLNWRPS